MKLDGKKIGFCFTGSFCTFKNTIIQLKEIARLGGDILPIMSFNSYELDTKFGDAKDFIDEIEKITRKKNYSYNTRSRTYRTKENDRCNGNCTMFRQYYRKTCKWHYRYTCINGSKIASKK